MIDPKFTACWPLVLKQECPYPQDWSNPHNFSNDPQDPGGATMCGIIQSEFNYYCAKHGVASRPVKTITQSEGEDIYYNNYWLPHCPILPIGLNLAFFDECVNTGPMEATRVLQYAINLQVDGVWGARTIEGITSLVAKPEITVAIKAYTARREAIYREMKGFGRFGNGWERRAGEIGADALKMVQ
jgi:lysozyme family protein